MAAIDNYAQDPQRALIDAASNPVFKAVLDAEDYEVVPVDQGDGTQGQAQAVKATSVKKAVRRIIAAAREVGVDVRHWICSKDEFNLCSKLNTPIGDLMRQLNAFLKSVFTEAVLHLLGLVATFVTIAGAAAAGTFLGIFSAVGFINKVFVELCACPVGAEPFAKADTHQHVTSGPHFILGHWCHAGACRLAQTLGSSIAQNRGDIKWQM